VLSKINLIKNIVFSNFKGLRFPYKMTFALTYNCNLKCKICKIWYKQSKDGLAIDEIEKIFNKLVNLNWLDLTGGEVTLKKDLIDIIRVIINNSGRLAIFHISSNGQLPEKIFEAAKEVILRGVIPVVNISIDGPKIKNDELRGSQGAYLKSLESFKLLKSLKKGYYYLSCTISDFNAHYIPELIKTLAKEIDNFSLSDLHFNIFHSSSHYYDNQEVYGLTRLKFDDIKLYLSLAKEGSFVKRLLEDKYIKGLNRYLNFGKQPVKCQALITSCFVNPYGDVYPCGIYDRPIGNLKDSDYSLNKLWNAPDAIETREAIESQSCPGCWSPCEAYQSILGSFLRI
jgi:MoaA/NifB/PqqE/SkfB family radical SAM enzyme